MTKKECRNIMDIYPLPTRWLKFLIFWSLPISIGWGILLIIGEIASLEYYADYGYNSNLTNMAIFFDLLGVVFCAIAYYECAHYLGLSAYRMLILVFWYNIIIWTMFSLIYLTYILAWRALMYLPIAILNTVYVCKRKDFFLGTFNTAKNSSSSNVQSNLESHLAAGKPKEPALHPAPDIPRMPKAAFAPRSENVCANCGKPLFKGAKFCQYCGHALQEQNIAHFANTILPKEKGPQEIVSECTQGMKKFTQAVAQAGYKIIHENAPTQLKACAITVYANISDENKDAADKFIRQQFDTQLINAHQFYQKYYAAALAGEVKAPDNPIYNNKRWPLLFIAALLVRECCGPLKEEDDYIAVNDLLVKNTAHLIEALL